MNKQVHVFYSGMVQGVGFRYTAIDLAEELGITGWVRNLRDGRVELVAEGDEARLQELLKRLEDLFGRYIRGTETDFQPASGEFRDFSLKF